MELWERCVGLCGVCDCCSCPEQNWILSASGRGEAAAALGCQTAWDSPDASQLAGQGLLVLAVWAGTELGDLRCFSGCLSEFCAHCCLPASDVVCPRVTGKAAAFGHQRAMGQPGCCLTGGAGADRL